jgi:O-antigen/teichoic acid export membrane protein
MNPPGSEEQPVSLTKSALQGVVWNYAGIAGLVVAQLISTPITARLISPAWFGAYATAQAAISFAGYFSLATIGAAILRRSELEEKTVGSAIFLSLTTAVLVLVALWFLAAPWANAWGIHNSVKLIRLMAIGLFFSSLASVPISLARRRLRFGLAALIETSTQVTGMMVGVVLAFSLHTAVALAIGQLIAGASLFVWASMISWREIHFGFDRTEGRELFTYSSQLSVLYFGSWAVNTIPSWYTGRAFGGSVLGLYNRASLVINMPLGYLVTGITKVLFPLYGRVRNDAVRTKAMLSEGLILATGFIWPIFAILAGAAPVVVGILLGPRWHAAIPLLRYCALIACGLFPTSLLTNAAEALGWIRFAAFRLIVLLALLASAVGVTAAAGFTLEGLLLGVAVAQWFTYAITLRPFISRDAVDAGPVVRSHLAHALAAAGAFGLSFGCVELLSGTALVFQAAGQIVVFAVVCLFVFSARSWLPASRILARRLAEVIPPTNPWHVRLRLTSARQPLT